MTALNPVAGLGAGATRRVTNSKFLRSGWSKGTGSGRMGRLTRSQKFVVEPWRIREWKVPSLDGFALTPYMSPKVPPQLVANHKELTPESDRANLSFIDYFQPENLPESFTSERKARWLAEAEKWASEQEQHDAAAASQRKASSRAFWREVRQRSARTFQ